MSNFNFSCPLLTIEEARASLVLKGWSNRALAAWWGCSEEYVSKILNNPNRKRHFDDALRGLPKCSDVRIRSKL
jgi:hypothetical protein